MNSYYVTLTRDGDQKPQVRDVLTSNVIATFESWDDLCGFTPDIEWSLPVNCPNKHSLLIECVGNPRRR